MGGAVVAVAVAGAGVAGGFVDGVEAGGFEGGVGGHSWAVNTAVHCLNSPSSTVGVVYSRIFLFFP